MSGKINVSFCKNALLGLLIVSSLFGCKNTTSNQEESKGQETVEVADSTLKVKARKIFHSIPSPLQVSALLKQAGAKYVNGILNPPSYAGKYSTNYSKALVVGVYGTDLAYANMFNQTQQSISYMEAIMKTSDGLGLTNMLSSSKLLKRFQSNMNNQDSLFSIIAELYRETDESLKENEQRNSASLILAGGWVEGLYIATRLAKINPNKDLNTRIAELKFSLNGLLDILEEYKSDPEFTSLISDLTSIKQTYDAVGMDYSEKAPTTDEESKVTTINTSSQAAISEAQLKELSDKVESLRTKIVKPN